VSFPTISDTASKSIEKVVGLLTEEQAQGSVGKLSEKHKKSNQTQKRHFYAREQRHSVVKKVSNKNV